MPRKAKKKTTNKKSSHSKEKIDIKDEITDKIQVSDINASDNRSITSLGEDISVDKIETNLPDKKTIESLENIIKQLSNDKLRLEQTLKVNEELIKTLRRKILNYQQKSIENNNINSEMEEVERWKDSALTMSQFIAEKMGFTQGQVLEKFGMIDA